MATSSFHVSFTLSTPPPIKVHGSLLSPATQRVLVCLIEKHLDFEFVPVDVVAGEQLREPFLSLNPFGQVPVVEHEDLKLFESRAITNFIVDTYPTRGTNLHVVSTNPKVMAGLYMWKQVEAEQFEPVAAKLAWELVLKPDFGLTMDYKVVKEYKGKLVKILDVYEDRLAETGSGYIGGNSFSLADLNHIPMLQALKKTQCESLFTSRVRVRAWRDRILARLAWSKVMNMKKNQGNDMDYAYVL